MSADDECLPCNVQVKAKRETERGGGGEGEEAGGGGGGGGGWLDGYTAGWLGWWRDIRAMH